MQNDHLWSFFNILYKFLGSIFEPCYIQNCVITNHVIKRLKCILVLIYVASLYPYDGISLSECLAFHYQCIWHIIVHMSGITLTIYLRCYSIHFYATAYSKNSGWALSITPVRPIRLSVRPSVCLSVRPSVCPTSCPGHNSQTVWNIFMKLHRCIHHIETMYHEQGRQLLHFWFLNYFRLA